MRQLVFKMWVAGMLVFSTAAWSGESKPTLFLDFDRYDAGKLPPGFSAALTGKGGSGEWLVRNESSGNKVLAQMSADKTGQRFPVCVYQDLTARDVDVSARFQPVSGEEDQAAGIVWRYKDANNYYVVRANALENNVVLYKVENGKRSDLKPKGAGILAYGKKAEVPSGQWSALRVIARGSLFEVFLNGRKLFELEDATFSGAGRIGLWTKADSVTLFDDFFAVSLDCPNASRGGK